MASENIDGMKSIFFVIIAAFLQSVIADNRSPFISYISQYQIKDIGGTANLQCSVLSAEGYDVQWVKMGDTQIALSSKTIRLVPDTRISLRYDGTSTYTIQITDLRENDAAWYQCRVYFSVNDFIISEVELQVRRPPFISDNSSRSVVVSEGEDVTLECHAGGFPKPKISWRRPNNAIMPTGSFIHKGNVLKIPGVQKDDRGTYYCLAENGVGKTDRHRINIEVEFAPIITVTRSRLRQALQYDMDLECQIEAYPLPAISWLKDGEILSNNQHHTISHFSTSDDFMSTTIHLNTIERRQYGNYVCRAENKFGLSETTIELYESNIPICPPACDIKIHGQSDGSAVSPLALMIFVLTMAAIER